MKITTPIMNLDNARGAYFETGMYNIFNAGGFSNYSPAYVLSNENLRWITGRTQQSAKRVLTATGSGDHPIFYRLNGATDVDTFDISYCAKAIMDIKTAALPILSRDEYIALLAALHVTKNAQSVPAIQQILPRLPRPSADFIRNMAGCQIFSSGLRPSSYPEHIPTEAEYAKMQAEIPQPFKFIWTDLESLHARLIGEYDVINLSNIFEYMSEAQIHSVLASLRNHVRPGGKIIAQSGSWGVHKKMRAYYNAAQKFKRWAKIYHVKEAPKLSNKEEIILLQRTR